MNFLKKRCLELCAAVACTVGAVPALLNKYNLISSRWVQIGAVAAMIVVICFFVMSSTLKREREKDFN